MDNLKPVCRQARWTIDNDIFIKCLVFFLCCYASFLAAQTPTDCQKGLAKDIEKAYSDYYERTRPLTAMARASYLMEQLDTLCGVQDFQVQLSIYDTLLCLVDSILQKEAGTATYKQVLKHFHENASFPRGLDLYYQQYKAAEKRKAANKFLATAERYKAASLKLRRSLDNTYFQKLLHAQTRLAYFTESKELTAYDSINYYRQQIDLLSPKTKARSNTIQALQVQLKEEEALIIYQKRKEDLYYALVVRRDSFQLHKLPIGQALSELGQQFLEHRQLGYDSLVETNVLLYQKVFAPFADFVKAKRRLYVVRSGDLLHLPLDALITQKPAVLDDNYGTLAFLVHRHSLVYLNTTQSLLMERAEVFTSHPLLVSPVFSEEMKARYQIIQADSFYTSIATIKSGAGFANSLNRRYKMDVLQAESATISAFKKRAKKSDFIHLDTHTFLDKAHLFTNSKIAFAKEMPKATGGLLRIDSLLLMDLQPKVLILGSCNTGVGELELGEGSASIAHQLQLKNISNIIYSTWSIEATATHDIFIQFYQALEQGAPLDYALQNAKIAYLAQNCDWRSAHNAAPYYWSGLVLSGVPVEVKIVRRFFTLKLFTLTMLGLLLLGRLFINRKFYCDAIFNFDSTI